MIIKDNKQVQGLIKNGRVVVQVIKHGNVVFSTTPVVNPYLKVSKTVIWAEPTDIFDILSNTDWVIN